jgi:heme/copper-type cytochrome/quinol oxidase subunit 2
MARKRWEPILEGDEPSRRNWAVALFLVGLLLGAGIVAVVRPAGPAAAPLERTFTIVAYHWGFVIFDEDGEEVPGIQVPLGTRVTLVIMGAEALNVDLHEAYKERTIALWADNPDYGGFTEAELRQGFDDAEQQGLLIHSVAIEGYGINVLADIATGAHKVVTFVADKAGSFTIRCLNFCGMGHGYMALQGGFVVG